MLITFGALPVIDIYFASYENLVWYKVTNIEHWKCNSMKKIHITFHITKIIIVNDIAVFIKYIDNVKVLIYTK